MKKVITAEQLRSYRGKSQICLDADTILTPSAQDAAREMGLEVRTEGCEVPLKSRESSPVALGAPRPGASAEAGELVIISAFGPDRPGILAGLSSSIAEQGGNVRDVSQTILEGYFSLILSVAVDLGRTSFATFKERVKAVGEGLGLEVSVQKQVIFQAMHRI
jgi:ACT domain-containing protein